MKRSQVYVVCIFVLLLVAIMAARADAGILTNYSADMETTTAQGSFTTKVFSKDKKMRMERNRKGHSSINILRPDKMLVWMLTVDNKTYTEIKLDSSMQDLQAKLLDANIKTEKEFIGNEVVDNHPTKKFHLTIITDGKRDKAGYIWEATALGNFVVKHESEDKKITTVWKNIKTGGVSDSLFELPPGYTKMELPAMPGLGDILKQKH